MQIPKETLLKCIELRKYIEKCNSPKREIEKMPHYAMMALLIGLSITSIDELQEVKGKKDVYEYPTK